MALCFKEFKDEVEELVELFTSNTWAFHGIPNPTAEQVRENYKKNVFTGDDCKTFWIMLDEDVRGGIIRIYDLEDSTPVFDLRIASQHKGKGIGTATLNWLCEYLFTHFPDQDRIEGTTRQDNYAMRCVFEKCGFAKEAHYRKAWADAEGKKYDAIGYGITKEDWQNGNVTPVDWNDFQR